MINTVNISVEEYDKLREKDSFKDREITRLQEECKKKYGKQVEWRDSNMRKTIIYYGLNDEKDVIKELTEKLNSVQEELSRCKHKILDLHELNKLPLISIEDKKEGFFKKWF